MTKTKHQHRSHEHPHMKIPAQDCGSVSEIQRLAALAEELSLDPNTYAWCVPNIILRCVAFAYALEHWFNDAKMCLIK